MQRRIVMVTGANAGIGFATARGLAAAGARVVLVCRDSARGEQAAARIHRSTGNDAVHVLPCDLSSQADIRRMVSAFAGRFERLHVLVNNAATYTPERTLSVDGIELQLATNYLSYFLLTRLLLDRLRAGAPARIVNLSTVNHFQVSLNLDDLQSRNGYEPKQVHVRSKLAVILFTYELARRLPATLVTANCLHPGVIATKLLGDVRKIPPERHFTPEMGGDPVGAGARTPLYLALSPEVEGITGKYFDECRAVASSPETRDRKKAAKLWTLSEALTGLLSDEEARHSS
ncbi:MAG: SDR family oxidoreductase [Pseudomonadota bacterium]